MIPTIKRKRKREWRSKKKKRKGKSKRDNSRSKHELYLEKLVRRFLRKMKTEVVGDDTESFERWQIDITIPEHKIAIELNGPIHYKPIFGPKRFEKICERDRLKKKDVLGAGWKFLVVRYTEEYFDKRLVAKRFYRDIVPVLREITSN